jgi:hypothetical protein
MLVTLYLAFPFFLLVSRLWDILQAPTLASHWLEDFPNWTQTEGNSPNSYIHASVSDLFTVFL